MNTIQDKTTFHYNSIEETINILKLPSSFRDFSEGLKELFEKKGFLGDRYNPCEAAEYLIEKLRNIGSSIEKETVFSWFLGKHSPKIEAGSRKRMYEICFALHLSYEETAWFFENVYYDRAFNCHTIEEAVFYYAFLHQLSYEMALELIKEIETAPTIPIDTEIPANYTQFVQKRITEFQSTLELKEFLIQNKENFHEWNKTAFAAIQKFVSRLTGSFESKALIDSLKRTLSRKIKANSGDVFINKKNYETCGLLIREILYDSQYQTTYSTSAEYIFDSINHKNIQKNTFLLERLLLTPFGLKKNPQIPYLVRHNFPSKKIMSDILSEEKISVSKSYDSIRKMIVLLDFYCFWLDVKLEEKTSYLSRLELVQIYKEEADNCLYHCGYGELNKNNPYDWIFLCSAQSEEPLEYFRACMAELLPNMEF